MWDIIIAAVVGLVLIYLVFLKKAKPPRVPLGPRPSWLQKQSKTVGEKQKGESSVRRNNKLEGNELLDYLNSKSRPIRTLNSAFEHAQKNFGAGHLCIGSRSVEKDGSRGRFQWKNYMEIINLRDNFGSGLVQLGVKPQDCVGIYSKNREEWIIVEQACYSFSFVIVSFYDTLGEDSVKYICNHSESSVVVCSKESTPKMLAVVEECDTLKIIIQMEKIDADQVALAKEKNIQLLSFEEVLRMGKEKPQQAQPPKPEDLCSIMYTSGTTGLPKGVLLTHHNLISVMAGAATYLNTLMSRGDSYLSYLPLAHIFERVVVNLALFRGCRVGFYQGDVRKIIEDVVELKPTFFAGVPRVLDKVYTKIVSTVAQSNPVKRWLFNKALAASTKSIDTGKPVWWLWDKLVLSKLRANMGGQVACILSGSAPLTPTVQKFMQAAFSCPVIQGYGLTETTAGATIAWPRDPTAGHSGCPIPCCEIKLVDVPEMNYTSEGDVERGEIAIRGPGVSQGYYKDEKKTSEEFRDGWFFTGDIGRWNKDGTLSIIDRKKNIFKLAHGEYVAAEVLEGVYARCKYVSQVWVHGDSDKFALIAVVVPNADVLFPWARENGLPEDMVSLCKNTKVNELILKELVTLGRSSKLRGFEILHRVFLYPEEFSVDKELVTPTFKFRRPQLVAYFRPQIDKMYVDIDATASQAN